MGSRIAVVVVWYVGLKARISLAVGAALLVVFVAIPVGLTFLDVSVGLFVGLPFGVRLCRSPF